VAPCGIYLYDYIKYGANNNSEEVKKLQTFLNNYMGSNLTVSGVYDLATMQALNAFQVQCKEEVLKPWVDAGSSCNINQPTGYVYITTQRWINLIMCPTLNLPMPDLSNYDKVNCTAYGTASGEEVLGEETTTEENNQQQFTTPETETPEGTEQTASVANALTSNAMPWWLILIIVLAAAALIWFIYKRMRER